MGASLTYTHVGKRSLSQNKLQRLACLSKTLKAPKPLFYLALSFVSFPSPLSSPIFGVGEFASPVWVSL